MRIILSLALGLRATHSSLVADFFDCDEQLNKLERRLDLERREVGDFEYNEESMNLLVATMASELDFLHEIGCENGSRITKLRQSVGRFAEQVSSKPLAFKNHAPSWFFYSDILKSAILRADDVLKHEFVRANDARAEAIHQEMTTALRTELDELRHALGGESMTIFGVEFHELEEEVQRLLDAFDTARDTAIHGWSAGAEARRQEHEDRIRIVAEQDADNVIGKMFDYARVISKRIEDSESEEGIRHSITEFISLFEREIQDLTDGISKYGLGIDAETQLLFNVVENWSSIRNELQQKQECWVHVLKTLGATEVKILDTFMSSVDISRVLKINFDILKESEEALKTHLQHRCPSIVVERLHDKVVSLVGYQLIFVMRQVIEQLAAARTHEEVMRIGVFGRTEIETIASHKKDPRIREAVLPALEDAVSSRVSSIMAAGSVEYERRVKVLNLLNDNKETLGKQAEKMIKAERRAEEVVTSLYRQILIPADWSDGDRKNLRTLISHLVAGVDSRNP